MAPFEWSEFQDVDVDLIVPVFEPDVDPYRKIARGRVYKITEYPSDGAGWVDHGKEGTPGRSRLRLRGKFKGTLVAINIELDEGEKFPSDKEDP